MSAMARVGYVLKRYPRFSETFVVNEILAHEEAGLHVSIFSLRTPEEPHYQEIIGRVRARVTYLPSSGKASDLWAEVEAARREIPGAWDVLRDEPPTSAATLLPALRLAREVRASGIGHLHAHFATSATDVARLAARLAGVAYTFTAHAKDIYHEDVREDDLRRKMSDAACTVTVSDYNLAHLTKAHPTGRIRRIYNGIDLDAHPYADPTARAPRVLSVGRLVEKKGLMDLVDACAILRERKVDLECRIVGTGPLAADLEARRRASGLGDRLQIVGALPRADVVREMQSAACFVAPCVVASNQDRDGLPTALLESMALGTPCISTSVVGIPELVEDGVTGLLVPERDPERLADAIERLVGDAALRSGLAKSARARIERDFDIRRNASLLRQAFQGGA